jgi:5-methylcytosine-specific restriction endonuclease McrA
VKSRQRPSREQPERSHRSSAKHSSRRRAANSAADDHGYYASSAWARKRVAAIERANHRCQICSAADALNVHHRTYERFEHERASDLIVLCQDCHALFHGHGKLAVGPSYLDVVSQQHYS